MKEYKVMCSNMSATYSAGHFIADSAAEACDMAREAYRKSDLGRALKDAGAFRFYTVDKFPHEREEEENEE